MASTPMPLSVPPRCPAGRVWWHPADTCFQSRWGAMCAGQLRVENGARPWNYRSIVKIPAWPLGPSRGITESMQNVMRGTWPIIDLT